jgi:orotate phosphoribosyltransferase
VILALDRQERGQGELSAVQEIRATYGIEVGSIIRLEDLAEHLEASSELAQYRPLVADYRERYGVA